MPVWPFKTILPPSILGIQMRTVLSLDEDARTSPFAE